MSEKKKVYLRDSNYDWQPFEYEGQIQEALKEALEQRNISIGYGASIGNGAYIGYGASIGNRASIGYSASIGNDASIGNGASIGYDASIGNGASIGYGASIGNRASIGYSASIGNGASIGYDASIGYGASIGNDASIGYGVKLITGIYFFGSAHPVTYVGEGKISIGCHCYPIDKWLKSFEVVGKLEGYSAEQIKEYGSYISLIATYYNSLPKLELAEQAA